VRRDHPPMPTSAADAQLLALLPALPVARVFRTSDGGESWTRCDVDALIHALAPAAR
jgi:hypothetical protein